MERKSGPGGKAWAMEGKGFYIVLFLCAAVLGASAWLLLTGAGTDVETEAAESVAAISDVVVTMVPAGTPMETAAPEEAASESMLAEPDPVVPAAAGAEESEPVPAEAPDVYVWPVLGGVEVPYAMETLRYDNTMGDWRTHDGIDIACALGDEVLAAANGLVTAVRNDDLYGTVVEIDHQNGVHSVYANLAAEPLVQEGDTVTMGQTIGSVGGTALAEVNMVPHLHLAMTLDGVRTDPRNYLPEILGE